MKTLVMPVIRHGLAAAAGALIARGILDAGAAEAFIGAGLAVVNLGWMIAEKRI